MKIALFHDFLVRMGGAEHVFFTMADMFPEAEIYTLFADFDTLGTRYPGRKVQVHAGAQKAFERMRRLPKIGRQVTKLLLPWYARWVEEMDFGAYDLVLVSSTAWALGLVTPVDTPVVAYVHSPARFLWDYYPEYKRELGAGEHWRWKNVALTRSLSKLRLWSRLAGQRADHMLCNSHTVLERICKFYRRDDVTVLYPPVHIDELQCKGANPDGDALIISTLTPYKNIDAVLSWWKGKKERLVIIGDGPDRKRLEALAPENVSFLGYVSQEERNRRLESARCFLYPSMEDFGIVPVEAMAAGKLTLALGKGGACETLEQGRTGVLFPDLEPASLEKAWQEFVELEASYSPEELRKEATHYATQSFQKSLMDYLDTHDLLHS